MTLSHTLQRAIAVVHDAQAILQQAIDEQALLDAVCRIAAKPGGYRCAWVAYATDHAMSKSILKAWAGDRHDFLRHLFAGTSGVPPSRDLSVSCDDHVVEQALRHRPPRLTWLAAAPDFGYEAAIVMPLCHRGEQFGILVLMAAEPDAFSDAEIAVLDGLAFSLALCIGIQRDSTRRQWAEQELRTERDTQQVLRKIVSLSLEPISLEEKLNLTLELLFEVPWLTLLHEGSIFLAEPGKSMLHLVAARHLSPILRERCARVRFGQCLCGHAASTGRLHFHPHVDAAHTTHYEGMHDHGHYCQPIRSANEVIGVLNLYLAPNHLPKPVEAQFLGAVADTLAIVIQHEQSELAQQRLVNVLEATPDMVTITDAAGRALYYNDRARRVLDLPVDPQAEPNPLLGHYPAEAAQRLREEGLPTAIRKGTWEGELSLTDPDGAELPVSQVVMAHRTPNGQVDYISTVAHDIRDRKKAELAAQALALSESQFANTVINSLPGIFFLADQKCRLLRWNGNLGATFGYADDQLRQMTLRDLVAQDDWPKLEALCGDTRDHGNAPIEIVMLAADGRRVPFSINRARIDRPDTGPAIVGIGIDISYRRRLELHLRLQATTDMLTGISNRLKGEESLRQELRKSARFGTPFCIGMFDIDHFKQVNDRFGHDAGDEVLKQVTAVAQSQLREVDLLTRWGGEEFLIIASMTDADAMTQLAERVRVAIGREVRTSDGAGITVSFGVSQYRPNESQAELMKRVDEALYMAKSSGRNRVCCADCTQP